MLSSGGQLRDAVRSNKRHQCSELLLQFETPTRKACLSLHLSIYISYSECQSCERAGCQQRKRQLLTDGNVSPQPFSALLSEERAQGRERGCRKQTTPPSFVSTHPSEPLEPSAWPALRREGNLRNEHEVEMLYGLKTFFYYETLQIYTKQNIMNSDKPITQPQQLSTFCQSCFIYSFSNFYLIKFFLWKYFKANPSC